MTIQIEPLKQKYYFAVDSAQLPEHISDILYQDAINNDNTVNYVDGDFDYPTSYNNLLKLFESFSKEFDEECDTPEELAENPYRELLDDLPSELVSDKSQKFLVRFYQ